MIRLSVFTFLLALVFQAKAFSAESIEFSGELRSIYDYGKTRNGMAIGGHLAVNYELGEYFSTRLAVYTAQPAIGSDSGIIGTGLVEGSDGFTLLGEFNLSYQSDLHHFTIGRQAFTSPLVTSHDAIMIQGLFSGVSYTNHFFESTDIRFMYFNEMSGRDNLHRKSEWLSMSKVLGSSYKEGMFALGFSRIDQGDNFTSTTQAWQYKIQQTLDTFYLSNRFKLNDSDYQLETHYWRSYSHQHFEADTNSKIDYYFVGSQISRDYGNLTLKFAYDRMNKTNDSYTISRAFGNYAIYTYGLRLDSGAYGANILGSGLKITSMNAIKFTSVYRFDQGSVLLIGYMLGRPSDRHLQSDMNLTDIAWFSGETFGDNTRLGIILEILDTNGAGVFTSETKLKFTANYRF